MKRIPVDSSLFRSIAYAEDECVLEAELHGGEVYRFFLVPGTVWLELVRAESKGAYFNASIRDRYPFVTASPAAEGDLTSLLEQSLAAIARVDPSDRPPT